MIENQRLILVIALSVVLFFIWQAWVEEQMAKNPPPAPVSSTEGGSTAGAVDSAADIPSATPGTTPTPAAAADIPAATTAGAAQSDSTAAAGSTRIRVITDQYNAEIDTAGGSLVKVGLLNYPETLEQPDQPFILLDDRRSNLFNAQSGLISGTGPAPNHYANYQAQQQEYRLADGEEKLDVPLVWRDEASGVTVTKIYTFYRNDFVIDVTHRVENESGQNWIGQQYRQLQRSPPTDASSSAFGVYTYTGGVISTAEDPYEKVDFEEIADRQTTENRLRAEIAQIESQPEANRDLRRLNELKAELDALQPDVKNGWIAMIQHYFLAAWVPQADTVQTIYTKSPGDQRYVLGMVGTPQTVAAGASGDFVSQLFVGPKIQDRLEALAPNLSRTVDYGWLWFIAEPLFWALKWIHGWVGNWGWAIIILTIFIKLAFYKLSETSYRSMANMRKLAPQMQKLKDRYGDDRQKLNQAMMEMYKKEKINPLGGCLPILVQIPVFIALYWMLLESVELRHAPWVGWIEDLSTKDPLYILPLIMGASMFVQQKLNPAPPDPLQARIMMVLPVVFTVFFLWFPAGLVLYWVVNNILSIAQQYVITKRVEAGTDTAGKTGAKGKTESTKTEPAEQAEPAAEVTDSPEATAETVANSAADSDEVPPATKPDTTAADNAPARAASSKKSGKSKNRSRGGRGKAKTAKG